MTDPELQFEVRGDMVAVRKPKMVAGRGRHEVDVVFEDVTILTPAEATALARDAADAALDAQTDGDT